MNDVIKHEELDRNFDKLVNVLKKSRQFRYPITDHPVAGQEEYIRGLYYDMLCVIAMYENDNTEEVMKFVTRIIGGDNSAVLDHITNAMRITSEKMEESIKQIIESDCKDIFFADALIICAFNGTPHPKQAEFLAEIADIFGYEKEKVVFLCQLAKAIVEQDFSEIGDKALPYGQVCEFLSCYVWDKTLWSTNENLYIWSPADSMAELSRFEYKYEDYAPKKQIVIENQIISSRISFVNVDTVKIYNCDLTAGITCGAGVKKIIIEKCRFHDMETENALYFQYEQIVANISCSSFVNIRLSNSNIKNDGLFIGAKRVKTIKIDNCQFIGIDNSNRFYFLSIISMNQIIAVSNSNFVNCIGDSSNVVLFRNCELTEENNTYEGCCNKKG